MKKADFVKKEGKTEREFAKEKNSGTLEIDFIFNFQIMELVKYTFKEKYFKITPEDRI